MFSVALHRWRVSLSPLARGMRPSHGTRMVVDRGKESTSSMRVVSVSSSRFRPASSRPMIRSWMMTATTAAYPLKTVSPIPGSALSGAHTRSLSPSVAALKVASGSRNGSASADDPLVSPMPPPAGIMIASSTMGGRVSVSAIMASDQPCGSWPAEGDCGAGRSTGVEGVPGRVRIFPHAGHGDGETVRKAGGKHGYRHGFRSAGGRKIVYAHAREERQAQETCGGRQAHA